MNKKSNLLLCFVKLLLYFCTEFPEFRCENALCVAGCYHRDIAAIRDVKIMANLHYVCQGLTLFKLF